MNDCLTGENLNEAEGGVDVVVACVGDFRQKNHKKRLIFSHDEVIDHPVASSSLAVRYPPTAIILVSQKSLQKPLILVKSLRNQQEIFEKLIFFQKNFLDLLFDFKRRSLFNR